MIQILLFAVCLLPAVDTPVESLKFQAIVNVSIELFRLFRGSPLWNQRVLDQVVGVVKPLMSKGFSFALGSGALWGVLLVLPLWLADFSASDITAGRFLAFSGFILVLVLLYRRDSLRHLDKDGIWHFLQIALFGNLFFYLGPGGFHKAYWCDSSLHSGRNIAGYCLEICGFGI